MKFKVGDEVKIVWDDKGSSKYIGISKIESIIEDYGHPYKLEMFTVYFKEEDLELVNNNNNKNMNIKEQFVLALLPEPQKSFRKVGITNGDNLLTDEGMRIYLSWRLMKDAVEFKKEIVDDMVAELEKSK